MIDQIVQKRNINNCNRENIVFITIKIKIISIIYVYIYYICFLRQKLKIKNLIYLCRSLIS